MDRRRFLATLAAVAISLREMQVAAQRPGCYINECVPGPNKDLRLCNFKGAGTTGSEQWPRFDFSGSDLRGANFWSANLRGSNFTGADMRGTCLVWADLTGSRMGGAKLDDAILYATSVSEEIALTINDELMESHPCCRWPPNPSDAASGQW